MNPGFSRWMARFVLPLALCACTPAAAQPPAGVRAKGMVRLGGAVAEEVLPVRLLAVGVSDFRHLEAADDLPTAESDARWFAEQLTRVIEPAEPPTVIAGAEATLARVKAEVARILGGARPGEVVILYFATHAAKVRNAGYLLMFDTIAEGRVDATALAATRLSEAIAETEADQVIVLADTVHQRLVGPAGLMTGPDGDVDAVMGDLATRARSRGKDVLVLTGGAARVPAPGDPCAGRGAFTCSVVAALQGRADRDGDGMATFAEVMTGLSAGPHAGTTTWGAASGLAVPVSAPVRAEAPRVPLEAVPEVRVCLVANGQFVPSTHTFRTGDLFAARVTVPEAGHLAIMNVGPDGVPTLLFPLPGEDDRVEGGNTVQVMPGTDPQPIQLVEPVGTERVLVVWSPRGEGVADERTLLALASARARAGTIVADAAPLSGATRSLTRAERVPRPDETCDVYRPERIGAGWVVELALEHA